MKAVKSLDHCRTTGHPRKDIEALECMCPGVLMNEDPTVRFKAYSASVPLLINDIKVNSYKVAHSPESNPKLSAHRERK